MRTFSVGSEKNAGAWAGVTPVLRAKRGSQGEAGMTLLELVIVIALLALMAGIVAPRTARWIDNWRLRSAAEHIAQTIRYARVRALYERRYYLVEIRPVQHQVRVGEPVSGFVRQWALPSDVQVAEEDNPVPSPVLRLILPPSGAVEEKTLWLLNHQGRKVKLHVDFLLGTSGVDVQQGSGSVAHE
jgi:prepilin-type N-terminal cleavage/methylation domain-containing protein